MTCITCGKVVGWRHPSSLASYCDQACYQVDWAVMARKAFTTKKI